MFGLSETELLYKEYIKELGRYNEDIASMTDMDIMETVRSYKRQKDTEWIDIYYNEKIVGFLIISSNEDECHPDADKDICQLYVMPQYRRHRLAYNAVFNYLSSHPGLYSYDIINGNITASNFWNKTLSSLGAKYFELKEVRNDQIANSVTLYGCMIDKNA